MGFLAILHSVYYGVTHTASGKHSKGKRQITFKIIMKIVLTWQGPFRGLGPQVPLDRTVRIAALIVPTHGMSETFFCQ